MFITISSKSKSHLGKFQLFASVLRVSIPVLKQKDQKQPREKGFISAYSSTPQSTAAEGGRVKGQRAGTQAERKPGSGS